MPTANRARFVPTAIRLFLAQDYTAKELVILDDEDAEQISHLIPHDTLIRYFREPKRPLGGKLNRLADLANGRYILNWADDDWYAPWRLRYQVSAMQLNNWDLCGISRAYFVDPAAKCAWEFVYRGTEAFIHGPTFCYTKSLWESHRFPEIGVGEDSEFLVAVRDECRIGVLSNNRFCLVRIHATNTYKKFPVGPPWRRHSIESIMTMLGDDWLACFGGEAGFPV